MNLISPNQYLLSDNFFCDDQEFSKKYWRNPIKGVLLFNKGIDCKMTIFNFRKVRGTHISEYKSLAIESLI